MAARFGEVLYWLGAGVAILFALAALGVFYMPSGNPVDLYITAGIFGGIALVAWLFGRACRYILAGR